MTHLFETSSKLRSRASSVSALCLLGLAACAGPASTLKPSETPDIVRLYPLRPGSVWTYDVDTGQPLKTLAITRVTASRDTRFEVTSGADPILYERLPDGLFRPDRGGYVLKAPLRKGARWDAGGGSEAEITDVEKSVTTLAGDFHHCVEVVEHGASSGKQSRTVFCPDVGPVELETSLHMSLSGETARVHATLRGYDFSGALMQPDSAP